jgi:hypothetical protein
LNSNENILSVWIDSDKNWHTHEVENCQEVKREEILNPKKFKKDESK